MAGGTSQNRSTDGPRGGLWTPRRRLWVGVLAPIAVSIFSQFEFVQNSRCEIAQLPWGVGQCEVIADLIAPAWALAIIPVANRLRLLAVRYGAPLDAGAPWLARKVLTPPRVARATQVAKAGALLIILLAYTREWERFDQQPDAVWYGLLIGVTLLLLVIPIWWIRGEIHVRGVRFLTTGRWPRRIDRFLFDDSDGLPPRWPHVLAFSAITMLVALMVLGQFDALVRGMHLPEDPPAGIGALPSVFEFDLSEKPDHVLERVGAWRDYSNATGAEFGDAYWIVVAHVLIEVFASIPAYLVGVVTLALLAWRFRRTLEDAGIRRAYELIVLTALAVLLTTAISDVLRNIFTWYVMDRAWNNPAGLTNANVRLLWFFSIVRTAGIAILILLGVLLLALSPRLIGRLRPALIAVRSELLLVAVFGGVVFMLPQTADVIRGWKVSHTVFTVGLVVVLSMLVRWTSAANLRLQDQHRSALQSGAPPEPRLVRIPFTGGETTTLKRFVGAAFVAAAVVQLLLSATTRLSVGRGLLIPAVLTVALALIGLGLPAAGYVRGDRPVSLTVRRRVPRLLGAALYLIVGVAVLKAAAPQVAYARHEDWYLFFALVPPAIGIWRIVTRTTHTMGKLEALFAAVLVVIAIVLLATAGNPELSPSALSFTGVTFSFGALAFFNSYHETSAVSVFTRRYLKPSWARPFVLMAAAALVVAIAWFYADPIRIGPQIGTIGMIVISIVLLVLAGAGAVRFAELTRPPKILASFGIKRTPVVSMLVLWLVLAPAVAVRPTNDIRVVNTGLSDGSRAGTEFIAVWERWSDRNLASDASAQAGSREVVPMLLVSSSGGGLRAAAWTSFVLDCLFEAAATPDDPCGARRRGPSPLLHVAVMSGVSGGALGIAEYATFVVDGVEGDGASNRWVDEVLGDDYLAGSLGWLFLADLPRTMFGFGAGISNRSEVMDRAWEASWPDDVPGLSRGIIELWESYPELPALMFNGTSVNDACRFNVSALDADGASPDVPNCSGAGTATRRPGELAATYDLVDFLCEGDDVPLSTAAGMVARFPVVSSSARVTAGDEGVCSGRLDATVYVVDGGYLEGSGSGTLLDAWLAMSEWVEAYNTTSPDRCVVPFMVHIDNGYESPSVSGSEAVPREFLVPLVATLNSSSGITAARAEAALAFEQSFTVGGEPIEIRHHDGDVVDVVDDRYARLVTRAHPGVQAPLGWTLSQSSIDDLRDQLASPENEEAFEQIRSWLDGTLTCGVSVNAAGPDE